MTFSRLRGVLAAASLPLVLLSGTALAGTSATSTATIRGESLTIYTYTPSGCTIKGVFVSHHGNGRAASGARDSAKTLADQICLFVAAPLLDTTRFPGDKYQYGGILSSGTSGTLNAVNNWTVWMSDGVAAWAKSQKSLASTAPSVLAGFSAGAQYMSRRAGYGTAANVATAGGVTPVKMIVAAASTHVWPSTLNTSSAPWDVPFGFGSHFTSRDAMLDEYLKAPVIIAVGSLDNDPNDPDLATGSTAMAQGKTRLERATNVYNAARAAAQSRGVPFGWKFFVVPGAGHESAPVYRDPAFIADIKAAVDAGGTPPPPPLPHVSVSDGVPASRTEGDGNITFTVSLSSGHTSSISVGYATENDTATAGSDYTAASGTLTFSAGQTSKTVTVTVTNDTAVESTETFNLQLTSATAGSTALVMDRDSGVGTIADNDTTAPPPGPLPRVSVLAGTPNPRVEGAGNISFPINLTAAADQSITVAYSTINEGAVAGSDYTAASGTVTFAASETSKTVTVTILNDTTAESTETFRLNLPWARAANGEIVGMDLDNGTGTIQDDDSGTPPPPPALSLSISDASPNPISEGGSATFTVTATQGVPEDTWVFYHTVTGTAGSGDFTEESAGSVLINGPESSTTITVPTTNDTATEGAETFSVVIDSAMLANSYTNVTVTDNTGTANIAASD